MRETRTTRLSLLLFWGTLLLLMLWAAAKAAMAMVPGQGLNGFLERLLLEFQHPLTLRHTERTALLLLLAACIWAISVSGQNATLGKWRRLGEHGTAEWGNPRELRRKWEERNVELAPDGSVLCDPNLILSRNMRLGIRNMARHRKNKNLMVIGGSGTRKSTGLVMPNIMQCSGSFVVTDPSGELHRNLGGLLEERGYEVRVLNLVDMARSHKMNPFWYVETEEDIGRLATSFIQNTDDKARKGGGDPFWTDAMKLLLMALISFLWEECGRDRQNFGTLTRLVGLGEIQGDEMGSKSTLDKLFDDVASRRPDGLAAQNYALFKGAAPRTRASVIITLSSRLSVFTLERARELTSADELELGMMGDRRQAVFCIIPQAETTFNFLVGLVYTSLFSVLYRRAEQQGRRTGSSFLPVPVQVLMDEFANIAQPDGFEQILATCRKYDISVGIFLQNITQLKKLYEKDWESIAGNCDTLIYLGGNEAFTWRYISEALDKETINVSTTGRSGPNKSVSQQIVGRDLMTRGEVRSLPDDECIVLVRGERGVIDAKYSIREHPNFKKISMGGAPPYALPEARTKPQPWEGAGKPPTRDPLEEWIDADFGHLLDESLPDHEELREAMDSAGGAAERAQKEQEKQAGEQQGSDLMANAQEDAGSARKEVGFRAAPLTDQAATRARRRRMRARAEKEAQDAAGRAQEEERDDMGIEEGADSAGTQVEEDMAEAASLSSGTQWRSRLATSDKDLKRRRARTGEKEEPPMRREDEPLRYGRKRRKKEDA